MAKLELMPFNEAQIRKDLKDLKIHEKGDQVVTEGLQRLRDGGKIVLSKPKTGAKGQAQAAK